MFNIKTKKLLIILLALLSTMLFACNDKNTSASMVNENNIISFKDTTIYGYIESIEDDTICLSIGSLMEMGQGGMNNPGAMDPNLNNGEINSNNNESDPPEIPDGENNGTNQQESDPPEVSGEEGQGTNPGEMPSGDDQGTNPGEMSDGEGQGTNPPEVPDGDGQGTNPGEMLDGEGTLPSTLSYFYKSSTQAIIVITDENLIFDSNDNVIKLEGLSTGNIIEIIIDSNSVITKIQVIEATLFESLDINPDEQGGKGDIGGGDSSSIVYSGLNTYTSDETISNQAFDSTGTDEECILVKDGATITFNNITLTRTSSDSTGGDNSSFYGVGAGLLVIDGTAYINGGSFTTDSSGGAGVFSYSTGKVYIAGATISTTKNTSGGIHVAGGGTLYAWDLNITTAGESSAAIRSDRGGGTMVVDGGTYTTNGTGSPSIYCTADIAVNNATLIANNSEAVCIEGKNTLSIFDSTITSQMPDTKINDTTWGFIVYQSMSGDSEIGCGSLNIINSTVDIKNGGVFYTTNTECEILIENTTFTNYEDTEFFLECTGNTNSRGWGTTGSNGSDCIFTCRKETISGNIIYDKASELDFYLLDNSTLTGKIYDDETYAGSATTGYASIYIDDTSKWVVTENSTVTNLYNAGTIVDADGNTVNIIDSNGEILYQGTSTINVIVTNTYSTTVDTTKAIQSVSFDTYKVSKPAELQE